MNNMYDGTLLCFEMVCKIFKAFGSKDLLLSKGSESKSKEYRMFCANAIFNINPFGISLICRETKTKIKMMPHRPFDLPKNINIHVASNGCTSVLSVTVDQVNGSSRETSLLNQLTHVQCIEGGSLSSLNDDGITASESRCDLP